MKNKYLIVDTVVPLKVPSFPWEYVDVYMLESKHDNRVIVKVFFLLSKKAAHNTWECGGNSHVTRGASRENVH